MSDIPDIPTRQWAYAESDVRVVPRGAPLPDLTPERSRAQQRMTAILDDAEEELRLARDKVVTALEDLALVAQPQHPNLPVLLGQQLEQVIELRRLHH